MKAIVKALEDERRHLEKARQTALTDINAAINDLMRSRTLLMEGKNAEEANLQFLNKNMGMRLADVAKVAEFEARVALLVSIEKAKDLEF